jgi:hypothetical protein
MAGCRRRDRSDHARRPHRAHASDAIRAMRRWWFGGAPTTVDGADEAAQFRAIGVVRRRKATVPNKKIQAAVHRLSVRAGMPSVPAPMAHGIRGCFPRET